MNQPGMKISGWLAKSPELIDAMWAAYQAGGSLAAIGRQFGRDKTSIRDAFVRRGYSLRPAYRDHRQSRPYRTGGTGQYQPLPPVSDDVVQRLILEAKRLWIPPELRIDWRKWSLERKAEFICCIRERLPDPEPMPTGPCSANVEPWAYGSPRAHGIMARANAGLASQQAPIKLKLASRGLIWLTDPTGPSLWFWVGNTGYVKGPYTKATGRLILHRTLYASVHGPLPESCVIRHIDGNWNNLDPANLVRITRDDLARENQAASLTKRSRERTALLLQTTQRKDKTHDLIKTISAR